MDILVVGMGTVGKATAKMFLELGHSVITRDIGGDRPYSDICFICVPESEVHNAIKGIDTGCLVIRSSTKPGTIAKIPHACHNPSFAREAYAYEDSMKPKMIVIGECCRFHGSVLEKAYSTSNINAMVIHTDPSTSEMIKLVLNCYCSTQISFWNETKLICDKLGISSSEVSEVCKLDTRVSEFGTLWHGQPFSGKCLPKDLHHLIELYRENSIPSTLLESVEDVNERLG